ncbi:MAG: hypothetical protein HOL48_01080, partial [Porticoccaceae bacterium]|nr:hypothetical protein [Porticoccaceae bacterium]
MPLISNSVFIKALPNPQLLIAGIFLFSASALFATEECPAPPETSISEMQPIEFDQDQSITQRAMLEVLGSQHFAEIEIDDELSELWLQKYLESLDPSHAYLLQADIREFRQNFATELDDLAKAGDLTAAKEIYDRFRGRA